MKWKWASFPELSATEVYAILRLRSRVFVVEQDCAYQDVDGRDLHCHHLLGFDGDNLVAYLRTWKEADIWIGRVVIDTSGRRGGLGSELMRAGMRGARDLFGDHDIRISAQAHLDGFYGALGFAQRGPGYLEDDIPHIPMVARPA